MLWRKFCPMEGTSTFGILAWTPQLAARQRRRHSKRRTNSSVVARKELPRQTNPALYLRRVQGNHKKSTGLASFRRSICQNFSQERQHVGDSEGFLEANGLTLAFSFLTGFNQVARHVNKSRFLRSRSFQDAGGGLAAVHKEAAGRKVQVAEKRVIAGTFEEGQSLLGRRRAAHAQTVSRQAFLKKHAETFFIVENEYRPACEKIRGLPNFTGGRRCRFPRSGRCPRALNGCNGQVDSEGRSASRKSLRFDVPAMFANDGHADAESQAGASAGTFGGVKRIENAWERFGADAHAVILDRDRELVAVPAGANLDAASVADFADSLFGISD